MKTMHNYLKKLAIAAMLGGIVSLGAPNVQADPDMFDIRVYHGINGKSLGQSKDLPVTATVELNGTPIAALELVFGDVVTTQLPAGVYKITVVSDELGPVDSMTVGPVELPAGANVNLHAKLSKGKTPIIKAMVK